MTEFMRTVYAATCVHTICLNWFKLTSCALCRILASGCHCFSVFVILPVCVFPPCLHVHSAPN